MTKDTDGIAGIAARLFRARKLLSAARGHAVTQAQIGAAVGVTEGQIGHWEKGRQTPDLATIERLAAALDVSPVWLSYGVGAMESVVLPAAAPGLIKHDVEAARRERDAERDAPKRNAAGDRPHPKRRRDG